MAGISLHSVTKTYAGGVVALDCMNLEITDGELLVILGPSGCGKTTMLRVIAGLERIDAGEIRMDGHVVNDVLAKDRDVAMVFQNYALYPHLTVYQNLAFALRLRRCPRTDIDRRVEDAAKMLGIEGLLDRKPADLSGGQRQRVAVGRAFVQRPRVFLFDEPLSNLDPTLRLATRRELKRLLRRLQTTAVYVTHDQEEAMTFGDRIAVMSEGVLQQIGKPLELYDTPANRFVASFIGTPPMNFLRGRIDGEQGLAFVTADGTIRLAEEFAGLVGDNTDRGLLLGVRPSDLDCKRPDAAQGEGITGRVEAIETPPGRWDVHVRVCSGAEITASLTSPPEVRAGETIVLMPDPSAVKVFESGPSGRNMLCAP
jgi:multiple sugar transport system ATP-binding protein